MPVPTISNGETGAAPKTSASPFVVLSTRKLQERLRDYEMAGWINEKEFKNYNKVLQETIFQDGVNGNENDPMAMLYREQITRDLQRIAERETNFVVARENPTRIEEERLEHDTPYVASRDSDMKRSPKNHLNSSTISWNSPQRMLTSTRAVPQQPAQLQSILLTTNSTNGHRVISNTRGHSRHRNSQGTVGSSDGSSNTGQSRRVSWHDHEQERRRELLEHQPLRQQQSQDYQKQHNQQKQQQQQPQQQQQQKTHHLIQLNNENNDLLAAKTKPVEISPTHVVLNRPKHRQFRQGPESGTSKENDNNRSPTTPFSVRVLATSSTGSTMASHLFSSEKTPIRSNISSAAPTSSNQFTKTAQSTVSNSEYGNNDTVSSPKPAHQHSSTATFDKLKKQDTISVPDADANEHRNPRNILRNKSSSRNEPVYLDAYDYINYNNSMTMKQRREEVEKLFVEMCFYARLGFVQPPCCLQCTYDATVSNKTKQMNVISNTSSTSKNECNRWVVWRKRVGSDDDPTISEKDMMLRPDTLHGNIALIRCHAVHALLDGKAIDNGRIRWDKANRRLVL